MWNCSELEKSPRSIWQTSRYFLLHRQCHIFKRDYICSCLLEIMLTFLILFSVTMEWFKTYFAAFGFCEYKEPESTLRALRLLHDLQIGDKNLLVKVDAKTKAQLDEWKAKKKTTNGVWLLYKDCSISEHLVISFYQVWMKKIILLSLSVCYF